ncbi:MAG TPA: hypothetical protein VN200_01440, partial [Rhodoglobus sp.]|nr:hypothetical protein [Rhodoglobus sp.]
MHISTSRRVGAGLAVGALIALGSASAAMPASAAETETVTFVDTGSQQTFTVPQNAATLTVTVAGAQGGTRSLAAPGGVGGAVTVDLGTAYNGQDLNLLIRGTGSGAYLATDSEFIAIAGGGGTTGFYGSSTPGTPLLGGAGGFATASPDGGDAQLAPGTQIGG